MTLTTYSDVSGSWTNGVTPLSAANMNAIRSFLTAAGAAWDSNISVDGNGVQTLLAQKTNPASSVLNGSTSGTATLYQPQQGTWKEVFIVLNNFRNSGGSTQTLAIPVPFTTFCRVETGSLFQIALQIGSTAQTIIVITALAGAGGSSNGQTNIAAHSFGSCQAAVDTIGFLSGGSSGVSSMIYLRGV